ncbi:uncharacterized protein BDZ99DRAFT_284183 [Mytilinidion resinicola]|uniref:Protein transport protein sec16 n=1 Tax=Mytilinidion resinicola TaxID=574789 RepID=A0A6A6YTU9_9PEZI|nr:uncharacterized protein BDZ99DRAFT_284183 [Mytilinidion resinicola]KAF2811949.1 hypothetical protein BDZ99DRAFT_284183 [Mytilinidion resinicola]
MGSDYGGPDFSYAYGGTPASASWNPAMRPDHDEQSPVPEELPPHPSGAVKEPLSQPESTPVMDDELPAVKGAAPAAPLAVFNDESAVHDDFFGSQGISDKTTQGNGVSQIQATNGNENTLDAESTPITSDSVASPIEVSRMGLEATNGTHNEESISNDVEEEHLPAEHYEHQGDSTFLEDAIQEHAEAPLATQAATPSLATPSIDWGTSGEVFDLGGKQQDGPVASPDIPQGKVGEVKTPEIDWGTTEDDDLFGAGADHIHDAHNDGGSQQGLWDLAFDDDFLPENVETVPPFEFEDDPGFLEDEMPLPEPSVTQSVRPGSSSANKYAPTGAPAPKPNTNPYGVQAPQFTDFSQMDQKSIPSPVTPFEAYGQSPQIQQQQQPSRPVLPSSALSFADKAKGGYHSPYDLPDDIVKPRRRAAPHHVSVVPAAHPTPPPPRSSSMYSNTSAGAARPPPHSNMSAASLSPPSSSHSMQPQMNGLNPAPTQQPPPPAKPASSGFFAELPIVTKPRHHAHAPPSGRYTPQHGMPTPPPGNYGPPQPPPNQRTDSWASQGSQAQSAPLIAQLQAPERLPAFPDLGTSPTRSNSLPVPPPAPIAPSRYSPAPPSAHGAGSRYSPAPPTAAPSVPRYSPAPPSQGPPAPTHARYASDPTGPPRPHPQPFAPRTSSPLAFHTVPQDQADQGHPPSQHATPEQGHHTMHSESAVPRAIFRQPLAEVSEIEERDPSQALFEAQSRPPMTARSATPPMRSSPSSTVGSPRKRTNYTPQYQPGQPQPGQPPQSAIMSPPRRSQTISPSATMKNPMLVRANIERRASVHDLTVQTAGPTTQNMASIIPHRRQFSRDFDFIQPTDERAADPLQRWKGHPIFQWGVGGTVVTSFPKYVPRYGTGSASPMMKANAGEVRIQSVKEACPLSEDIAKFPGPLKAKSKKKDVSTWLTGKIGAFETDFKNPAVERAMSPEELKRFEEKILLWKVMQILVDNDGLLEGNPTVEQAVRKVLSPHGVEDSSEPPTPSYSTAADIVGRARSASTNVQAEPIDPKAVDELRTLLTRGDREKAVWHAVDQRLWAHAMLLSSTLDKSVWKQVVQEFVRNEVKKIGGNTQALAVLYEVFAGNWEDCIDELVPASARAGFQMMSTDANGAPRNALQGLDRWQESLLLILSNRSEGDVQALLSLGRLLAGYGRIEAAHICFIFGRSTAYFGGLDDPQSDLVLVGADHRANPESIGKDLEPLMLTEIYEYALSLHASSAAIVPHLQNFKLAHAFTLAEFGYRNEAQHYCDAIGAAIKATTRVSPYYNNSFIMLLEDLTKRLSHSPKDGSSSWISKPSMDKVSGSFFAKFTSFVAGDESDAVSNHSGNGPAEVGPFARIGGNTPTISPVHSNADIYGTYGTYPGAPPSAGLPNSRYAPGASAAPRGSSEQPRSRYDPQAQSPYQGSRPLMESSDGSQGFRRASENYMLPPQLGNAHTPGVMAPPQRAPMPRSQSLYSPDAPEVTSMHTPYANPYQPAPLAEETEPSSGYQPLQQHSGPPSGDRPPPGYESPSVGYEPPASSYKPPTGSYEPPTYEPYQPDAESAPPVLEKKKSFMDDDEDDEIVRRAAELKRQQKAEADKKADEAFRKAAEADAAKDKKGAQKGGWISGWFKKDPNAAPAPIKAKLGEENSFVYDADLGKWVNKKAGGSETASAARATPPPPKSGPPSRSVSGNSVAANHALGQLGSSLPHSYSAPGSRPPTSTPNQRSSSMPPPSAPGSRAGTPARVGTPGAEGEGSMLPPTLMPPSLPAGSGPPSRPGTGMSTASSIEDLIGAPQARAGGTVKRNKKKGGRYIDVMAQGS